MNFFWPKIKEAFFSILPIFLIALILSFMPFLEIPLKSTLIFIVSSILAIFGIALFNLGADLAMNPMGEHIGSGLAKKKKLGLLLLVVFVFGLVITIAEPDLQVLASEVTEVISTPLLIIGVGVGLALFLVIAVLRLVFKKNLGRILMLFYMLIFGVAILVNKDFLPLAFDSGGVTTGPITVPFIMALGIGLGNVLSEKKAQENSFGFVSLCSAGPILLVLLLFLFSKNDASSFKLPSSFTENRTWLFFLNCLIEQVKNVSLALGIIVVFFTICNFSFLHLPKKRLIQIAIGILYTYFGLIFFMTSVNVGFMPIGYHLGLKIASISQPLLILLGFIIGMLVVLAEPAVHVLVKQVEEVTGGYITKKSLLISLSIGVGISMMLSMIRIVFGLNLMFFIIPGYFISLALSIFIPNIYTAIAFDSGGVASGPMTSTFILPFAIGACETFWGEAGILGGAFGIVAMVAMTPLITIQFLGFRAIVAKEVKRKIAMKRILDEDDDQIISFM